MDFMIGTSRIEVAQLVEGMVTVVDEDLQRYRDLVGVEELKGGNDLVTAADRAIEVRLGALLKDLIPGSSAAGEENEVANEPSKLSWVIDPIDGTVNFSRGYEFYTSVACLIENGSPLVAVVYQPQHRVVTVAVRGGDCSQWDIAVDDIHDSPSRTLRATSRPWQSTIHSLMLTPKLGPIARTSSLGLAEDLLTSTLGVRILVSQAYEAIKLAEGGVSAVISLQSSGGWTRDAARLLCECAGGRYTKVTSLADSSVSGFLLVADSGSLESLLDLLAVHGYRASDG